MDSADDAPAPGPSNNSAPVVAAPKRMRGRPRGLHLSPFDSTNARSTTSSPAPPTPRADSTNDPLAGEELAAFGVSSIANSLPEPPKDGAPYLQVPPVGSNKRGIDAVVAPTPPLSVRAKRPKSVKISPAKGARRSIAGTGDGKPTFSNDTSVLNNDFCDACLGKGEFLCCDGGCLRSFHLACLDPPLDMDDVPDDDWFCKACRAQRDPPPKPPRMYFRELIHRLDCENPKVFSLTPDIKAFYRNVATGNTGEFLDALEHRPPSRITGRGIGQDDRDGYRLKDKFSKPISCYRCNEPASIQKQRRIISCDFCEQHWHLDCLDPPMTGMPPPTRKWMCPIHSELALPKVRVPKQTITKVVHQPGKHNNGDIVIQPRRELPRIMSDFEEVTVNHIRYQVPEETVILDFWGRVNGGPRIRAPASPHRKRVFKELLAANSNRDTSPDSMDSPLTSLGDLSDVEMLSPVKSRNTYVQHDESALRELAIVAESYFAGQQAAQESRVPSEAPAEIVVPAPPPETDVQAKKKLDKGKGRATDFGPELAPMVSTYGTRSSTGARVNGVAASVTETSTSEASTSRTPVSTPSQPVSRREQFEQMMAERERDRAKPRKTPPSERPLPTNDAKPFRVTRTLNAGSSANEELVVRTADDYKSLMNMRKIMKTLPPEEQKLFVEFMSGKPLIPKMAFKQEKGRQLAWDLPWEASPSQTSPDPPASTQPPPKPTAAPVISETSPVVPSVSAASPPAPKPTSIAASTSKPPADVTPPTPPAPASSSRSNDVTSIASVPSKNSTTVRLFRSAPSAGPSVLSAAATASSSTPVVATSSAFSPPAPRAYAGSRAAEVSDRTERGTLAPQASDSRETHFCGGDISELGRIKTSSDESEAPDDAMDTDESD